MNYKDKSIHYLNSGLILILILILGGMLAYVSTRFFFRWDVTELNQFSISSSTQSILESLDDPVNIRVYFSKNLPPQFLNIDEGVKDILTEYNAYGGSNINIRYLDPSKPDVAQEAESYGIPQIQMDVIEKDQRQVRNGYLGLVITYEDRFEFLPVVENTQNLEYQLTSAIKKVTSDELKMIGFLTGHGEKEVQGSNSPYSSLLQNLADNYQLGAVDLNAADALSNIDTLVVAGPRQAISDEHLLAIDQFMMKGNKVIFLVDQIELGENLTVSPIDHNLNDFLSHFGVTLEEGLMMDASNANASFNQGFITYTVAYPLWVRLLPAYFEVGSPIINQLTSIVLPWASPLQVEEKEGLTSTVLAKTTPQSMIQVDTYDLNPNSSAQLGDQKPSVPMIAMVMSATDTELSAVSSYFKDKEIEKGEDFLESPQRPLHFMVVGNSRFIENSHASRAPQNLAFLLNALDFMTLDESLISIRSKDIRERPIKELSDTGRLTVKFFAIYFMPLLVILFGVGRAYWLRSVRSKKF